MLMPVPTLFWLTALLAKLVIQVVPPAEPLMLMPVALETTALLLKLIVSVPAPAVVLASKALPVAASASLSSVAVKAPAPPSERLTPLPVAPRTLSSLIVTPTVLAPEEMTATAVAVAPVVSRSSPRISTRLRVPPVAGDGAAGAIRRASGCGDDLQRARPVNIAGIGLLQGALGVGDRGDARSCGTRHVELRVARRRVGDRVGGQDRRIVDAGHQDRHRGRRAARRQGVRERVGRRPWRVV